MTERVGLIGAGLMGHGIGKTLLERGARVTILSHRNRVPVEDLTRRGAMEARSVSDLTKQCDVIFLCVPTSSVVEELVCGPAGIRDAGRAGLLVVDCSTSDPRSTLGVAAQLAPLGISFCDAPLGGTPAQAEAGSLSAFVGCAEEAWPRLERVIGLWAAKVVRVGGVADGHKLKLLMNFLSLGYAALYAELVSVAAKNGITPRILDAAIQGSRMDCGVYQTYFRWVLQRDAEAHKFTLHNAHKDMKYLAKMAQESGVPNPLGAVVNNYIAAAVARGHGDDFVPTLADFVATSNGISL